MVLDLAGLLRALVAGDVRFVVIGGIAVAAHRVIRATEDVDIVPDPEHANLDRLCDVLASLDARLVRQPERGVDADVRSALRHSTTKPGSPSCPARISVSARSSTSSP